MATTPIPTPIPTQTPINNSTNLKPSARKLPIKRKTPPLPHPPPPLSNPNPNPNPNPAPSYDDYDNDDDEEFDDDDGYTTPTPTLTLTLTPTPSTGSIVPLPGGGGGGGDDLKSPPFKFHRIWSESDEIRFLQGLLGCWSQGLVFPRDLNIFYDRFSESMPQPYTRSQLSEKLRRLRKKFRIMSTRIARGQDPDRLAPHDRDLLHLCTRLWHPSHASTSPFSAPDSAASTAGNKRRRPNPRVPPVPLSVEERREGEEEEEVVEVETVVVEKDNAVAVGEPEAKDSVTGSGVSSGKGEESIGYVGAKTVLDAFDEALKEVQMRLKGDGSSESELSRRWKEQRLAEIDVFARRLRLVVEQSLRN